MIVFSKLSSIRSSLNTVLQSLFRRKAKDPTQVITISSTSSIRIEELRRSFQCAINIVQMKRCIKIGKIIPRTRLSEVLGKSYVYITLYNPNSREFGSVKVQFWSSCTNFEILKRNEIKGFKSFT